MVSELFVAVPLGLLGALTVVWAGNKYKNIGWVFMFVALGLVLMGIFCDRPDLWRNTSIKAVLITGMVACATIGLIQECRRCNALSKP